MDLVSAELPARTLVVAIDPARHGEGLATEGGKIDHAGLPHTIYRLALA